MGNLCLGCFRVAELRCAFCLLPTEIMGGLENEFSFDLPLMMMQVNRPVALLPVSNF